MEKAKYKIRSLKLTTHEVNGYVFRYSGERFGVAKDPGSGIWTVTELRSGAAVVNAMKREDAINKLTSVSMKMLKERIAKFEDINPEINPKDEILVAKGAIKK